MVTLVGFGSFYVGKRNARSGRNPRTNEPIKIRAAKVPKFRAGKALEGCAKLADFPHRRRTRRLRSKGA